MIEAGIELLTAEYVEEILAAGAAKYMDHVALALFISELVLGNYGAGVRRSHGAFALQTAQLCLLPEECRRRGIEVDAETVVRLRDALA